MESPGRPEHISFANAFRGPSVQSVSTLFRHVSNNKHTAEELHLFYQERASIEQEYSNRLAQLVQRPLGTYEVGTLKAALDEVKANTEKLAQSHSKAASQFNAELQRPLLAFAHDNKTQQSSIHESIEKVARAKATQERDAEVARDHMEREQHRTPNHANTPTQYRYQKILQTLQETVAFLAEQWKNACDQLEQMEEERINFLKTNLWIYANIVSTACVNDDESCENIRLSLENCSAKNDVQEFARRHRVEEEHSRDQAMEPDHLRIPASASEAKISNALANLEPISQEGSVNSRISASSYSDMEISEKMRHAREQHCAPIEKGNDTLGPPNSHNHTPLASPFQRANPALDTPKQTGNASPTKWSSPLRPRYGLPQGWTSRKPRLENKASTTFRDNSKISPGVAKHEAFSFSPHLQTRPVENDSFELCYKPRGNSSSPSIPHRRDDPLMESVEALRNKPANTMNTLQRQHKEPFNKSPAFDSRYDMSYQNDHLHSAAHNSHGDLRDNNEHFLRKNSNRQPKPRPNTMYEMNSDFQREKLDPSPNYHNRSPNGSYNSFPHSPRGKASPMMGTTPPNAQSMSSQRYSPASPFCTPPSQNVSSPRTRHRDISINSVSPSQYRGSVRQNHHGTPPSKSPQPGQVNYHPNGGGPTVSPNHFFTPQGLNFSKNNNRPNSRQSPTRPPLPTVSRDGRAVLKYCRARFDYKAAIPDEISFRAGSVLLILRMLEDGWWESEVLSTGQIGLAPSNFLSPI